MFNMPMYSNFFAFKNIIYINDSYAIYIVINKKLYIFVWLKLILINDDKFKDI